MQLESAQILCTVATLAGDTTPYRPTHINHPCTIWAAQSKMNWLYLRTMAFIMEQEWRFRFDKPPGATHKSIDVIRSLTVPPLPNSCMTPFSLAMPDKYKCSNAIQAYRSYYTHEKETYTQAGKIKSHTWTKRSRPVWMDKNNFPV